MSVKNKGYYEKIQAAVLFFFFPENFYKTLFEPKLMTTQGSKISDAPRQLSLTSAWKRTLGESSKAHLLKVKTDKYDIKHLNFCST